MVRKLLEQLKQRRLDLKLKQKDMRFLIGVSRQQYQHLESKGNPRLITLELIAKGLKSELMLIPVEKLNLVKEVLESDDSQSSIIKRKTPEKDNSSELANDPWEGLLADEE